MTAETNGHASPHTFHTSPTYLPHISHTSPTHLPRIFHASPTHLPRISHVQAGLQPACFRLRVCNPRQHGFAPLALKGLRRRNAAPPKVAALFHFPGSQTRPQKASGCKPAATGESTWKFAWGQCGSLYCIIPVHSTCLPCIFHASSTHPTRIFHTSSTYLPRSGGFATRLLPVAGLQPAPARFRSTRPKGFAPQECGTS